MTSVHSIVRITLILKYIQFLKWKILFEMNI